MRVFSSLADTHILQARARVGFVAAFLLAIAVGILAFSSTRYHFATTGLVLRTQEVLERLDRALLTVFAAQSSERGYVITGNDAFLESYENAVRTFDGQMAQLRSLTQDNSTQQANIDALAPLVDQKRAVMDWLIQLRRVDGFEAARDLIASGTSEALMDEIVSVITAMREEENQLLVERLAETESSARITFGTLLLFTALICAALVTVYLIIRSDIIGRQRAEVLLNTERNLLRTLIDSIPDIIFVKDREGRFILANKAMAQRHGLASSDAIIGKHDRDFFSPELVDRYSADEAQIFATGQPQIDREEPTTGAQGQKFTTLTTKVPLLDSTGKIEYLVGISHDISERKAAQEAIEALNSELERHAVQLEAANRELEAFSYSVSHDLRAPLRAIDGFSRILVDEYAGDLNERAQRYLTLVRENALQMGRLIDDLLAFSRLNRQALNRGAVDMNMLVQSVLTDLRPSYAERTIELAVEPLPSTCGDPALLRQVYVNLISNAVKFTGKQAVAQVTIGSQVTDGETVYFVRDNGAGFDMRYAHKLFGVFQRLHRQDEFDGTGVGLAIVQRVIQRHGGRVWAEAAVNQGATFYFTLPESHADEPATD